MNVLVTGGAGFIGRWVVKQLLEDGHHVWVIDDLSNGSQENLAQLLDKPGFRGLTIGSILDADILGELFAQPFEVCFHLAASINVQDSIDNPRTTFENDTVGTFLLLEQCKKHRVKMVLMSTCMVYDRSTHPMGISETDPIKPASPYAGAKLAAECMALSYHYTYDLPVVVVRPFNTYGPFQKAGGEGGVVSIFLVNCLDEKDIEIYGDGTQTRDLLYVEDCARFVTMVGYALHMQTGKSFTRGRAKISPSTTSPL
ncbi:UNVERIFIED_CONTAM: UDP-glucose 4-epimerase [Brevibacillus sp. OAP136]